MITKENCSIHALKGIFDAAFLECYIDQDGDLCIKHGYKMLVGTNPVYIQLLSYFGVKEGVSPSEVLMAVNRVNSDLIMPKAYTWSGGGQNVVVMAYVITIGEGLAPRALVESVRIFNQCIDSASSFLDGVLL